jgi:hypothetical protein
LAVALCFPVFFMVPYNDEWLRMNYLADHSVWQWTVMHTQTWVVRPTAELIMAVVSARTTRAALGEHATARAFLAHFHAQYLALMFSLLALLGGLAVTLAPRGHRFYAWAAGCGCLWLVIWASDELGYAFYWADGYANVVLPFTVLLIGMALICRASVLARCGAAACLIVAALGHEVLCIYSCGFMILQLLRVHEHTRRARLLYVLVLLAMLGILYAQGFSEGPAQRTQAYLAKTGSAYNLAGALKAVRMIDPLRSATAWFATLAWLAGWRARLQPSVLRAEQHAARHRWYWAALAAGALITSAIPLASVGLKKATILVAAYSVATELFIVLSAALCYPLLSALLDRVFAPYRRHIVSVLPVLLAAALVSPNLKSYRSAWAERSELREQAQAYMQTLYDNAEKTVRVTRPCHPFIKPASGMTMRNVKEYFALSRIKEVDCKPVH